MLTTNLIESGCVGKIVPLSVLLGLYHNPFYFKEGGIEGLKIITYPYHERQLKPFGIPPYGIPVNKTALTGLGKPIDWPGGLAIIRRLIRTSNPLADGFEIESVATGKTFTLTMSMDVKIFIPTLQ